ncbi:MAG: tRNA lysidine(34) synthetase TilS [Bacteroidales bacterium]|nr:tRNA lysidine(34) synthetase TilS [Bacteroidales bacterium]
MQKRFNTTIRGLFPEGETVLLAVSGGIDSMCLADLFLHSGVPFEVANCNFHLRGEESDGDSDMVRQWCGYHGTEFHCRDFDTEAYASQRGVSIEMAARELRYGWFDSLCRERGYAAVAVAHNANDNAETMVLNMLRGSGIKGMSGMKLMSMVPVPGASVPLCRPLLEFSRKEIEEYVAAHEVPFREDSTNAETEYRRNKVRHLVFPQFAQINPSFLEALGRDMANLAQVSAVADDWYGNARTEVVSYEGADEARISVPGLRKAGNVGYMLYRLLEPYGFNSSDIASLQALLDSQTVSGKVFEAGDWQIVTSSSELVVRKVARVCDPVCIVVEGPGLYEFAGVRFSVSVEDRDPGMPLRQPAGVTVGDAGTMVLPFLVRKWRNGDWMMPIGLHGKKKLSDMFVDLKMSLVDKEKALVAVVPGMNPEGDGPVRVAALLGRRVDETVKVTADSRKVVIVRILS